MYKSRIPSLSIAEIRQARGQFRERLIRAQEDPQHNFIFMSEPLLDTKSFSTQEFIRQYTNGILEFRRHKANKKKAIKLFFELKNKI